MNITDLFDEDLFRQMQDEKMVTIRDHDRLPYKILNYSDGAQYANCWNDVTINSRGLIYQALTGKIIARPWKKFFNLGDAKAPYVGFNDLAEVTDKLDGSLGILYPEDEYTLAISTRGSFHSDQARWATKQIKKMSGLDKRQVYNYTFLFEIIYPANRIVVDYGNFEGLVLLGAVSIETGHAMGPHEAAALLQWPGIITDIMPYKSIADVLAADDRDNTEGYVIRAGDRMIKWKRPDYIELHRLISNLSEKSVWSGLAGGKTVEELIEGLPDEFHGFVRETSEKLLAAFSKRRQEVRMEYIGQRLLASATLDIDCTPAEFRKGFARSVKDNPDKKHFFLLLDKKDIDDVLWMELKPKGGDNEGSST